jgi:hypothetical protein
MPHMLLLLLLLRLLLRVLLQDCSAHLAELEGRQPASRQPLTDRGRKHAAAAAVKLRAAATTWHMVWQGRVLAVFGISGDAWRTAGAADAAGNHPNTSNITHIHMHAHAQAYQM